MHPYKLKQQRLKLLAHTERQTNMKTGNGQAQQPTPEQLTAQAAQARVMQAAFAAQQRQGMATSLLSGILSGLYSNIDRITDDNIDNAIDDCLTITDRLHARLVSDAQAGLKANTPQPEAPKPDKPASGDAPQPGAETGSGTAVEPRPEAGPAQPAAETGSGAAVDVGDPPQQSN